MNQFFNDCNSWNDFQTKLLSLNKKEKGNAFEFLTKLYFKIHPVYSFYDDVWLLNEVPQKTIEFLGIPSHDLGIDLIAKNGNEYHAIQCKFHTDIDSSVSFKEVATFISMLEGNKKFTQGYICSSANITSRNFDKIETKPITTILADTWQNLDSDFFDKVRKFIKKEKYAPIAYQPKEHQINALKQAVTYFEGENNKRGKLIFPCGAGKSLTGYWLTQELNSKATLIAVPSLSLVKQTLDVYLREIVAEGKNVKWLCICSDEGIGTGEDIVFKTENLGVPCQTNPEYIKNWLQENKDENVVIFTTYQSGRIISEVSKELNFTFDVGIFDEAHKTVGSNKKLFSYLLFEENIAINKRIFMTATERFYAGSNDEIISMDDEDIYGDIFAQMSFKEAIELELLTDYKVITIDVKKSEIAEFIKDNNLVQLNDKWKKETEARSLASMLALRKAMKLFPIKNAVSFHSSIEKAIRNKDLQDYITDTYNYSPIDTFTVSGKMPTTKRNIIVKEFADSPKSLITNARCLTEGVDVPNIDCIVFSDPRKSKVDIVQALGRALRKKEGKEWGYVILPVIYDDITQEIDNENFNEILAIVRGLASNDDRIIEYFKDKKEGTTSNKKERVEQFQFEVFSDYVDANQLANQLQIKLWEKLSKFNWMPFEEAREFVRCLNLKSHIEWSNYIKNGKKPNEIPSAPSTIYKLEWKGYGDFLGNGNIAARDKVFRSFIEAREFVRMLNLKGQSEWLNYCKSGEKPDDIPSMLNRTYKEEWKGFGDFLGTGNIASKNRVYRPFIDAREFVIALNLNGHSDWSNYIKTGNKPNDIPSAPNSTYKLEWNGWGNFLGTGTIAPQKRVYRSFKDASDFIRTLNLKSQSEWKSYTKSGQKPEDIPTNPNNVYKEDWKGFGDFLGTGNIAPQDKLYRSYIDAREFVHTLNLKSCNEWIIYAKSANKPSDIPASPNNTYKKEWKGFGDFLGNGNNSNRNREYRSFEETTEFVRDLNLNGKSEWTLYAKSSNKPKDIPAAPYNIYKDDWKGWGYFLGNGNIATQHKKYRSFIEVKKIIKILKLKSGNEYLKLWRENKLPNDFPAKPNRTYKDEWKGMNDFLGKE